MGFSLARFFLLLFDVPEHVFAVEPLAFGFDVGCAVRVRAVRGGRRGDGNVCGGFAILLRNFTIRPGGCGLFWIRYRLLGFLRGCLLGSRFVFSTLLLGGCFRCGCVRFAFLTRCLAVVSR